ncbi:MAG: hypothetical protein JWQ90_5366 [Hydrocarboniphaga sp.]|uniref:hypothetical protein n=1 Tax=Hydrocarboniphaga sp. TaxID=2033016 RepID=UPI002615A06A|nr:hypothetical protein [Hydrocarboniphaga sp.]MDB5972916.1 hypothetical protein [Hydrocarboniphaga sp.]
MRTTLDIDDDVLGAAKEIARREQSTAGAVISRLSRAALTRRAAEPVASAEPAAVYGFRPLPASGTPVTNDLVNRLREDEGI